MAGPLPGHRGLSSPWQVRECTVLGTHLAFRNFRESASTTCPMHVDERQLYIELSCLMLYYHRCNMFNMYYYLYDFIVIPQLTFATMSINGPIATMSIMCSNGPNALVRKPLGPIS